MEHTCGSQHEAIFANIDELNRKLDKLAANDEFNKKEIERLHEEEKKNTAARTVSLAIWEFVRFVGFGGVSLLIGHMLK